MEQRWLLAVDIGLNPDVGVLTPDGGPNGEDLLEIAAGTPISVDVSVTSSPVISMPAWQLQFNAVYLALDATNFQWGPLWSEDHQQLGQLNAANGQTLIGGVTDFLTEQVVFVGDDPVLLGTFDVVAPTTPGDYLVSVEELPTTLSAFPTLIFGAGFAVQPICDYGDVVVRVLGPTNSPPDAADDSLLTDEDVALDFTADDLLANDTDPDGILSSPEIGSTVTILSDPSNGVLTDNGDGTFRYAPDPDFFGTDSFTYQLCDPGGLCDTAGVTVTVLSVNDAPSFLPGGDQEVDEDSGAQVVPGWATGISPGPANEAEQQVTFLVTNDNAGLFAAAPAISPAGELTYTPADDAHGVATVTVVIMDDGGTERGGVDIGAEQTFTITVNSVIDALIDVKPGNGDDVDPINLDSTGVVPIAILATQVAAGEPDDFDPTQIDLDAITFEINGQSATPTMKVLEDVDGDGDLDLLLFFSTADLAAILDPSDVDVVLTAEYGGAALGADLGGADSILIT